MTDLVRLGIAVAAPQIVGVVGALAGPAASGGWYRRLAKPAWRPPDAVFGPVWTLLYLLMGLASFLVWKEAGGPYRDLVPWALALYAVQLVLNLAWSWLFFRLRSPLAGLLDLGALTAVLVATVGAFFRVSRAAGWLLVPYLLWVLFALALNASIWRRNRPLPPPPDPGLAGGAGRPR